MDTLPGELHKLIVGFIPEDCWGPLRLTSRSLFTAARCIVIENLQTSPAILGRHKKVFSMKYWLDKYNVPIDQKFRIVFQRIPRRGLVKYLLEFGSPTTKILSKFVNSIISDPSNEPYSRADRARVVLLFTGRAWIPYGKIAALSGVTDLVCTLDRV